MRYLVPLLVGLLLSGCYDDLFGSTEPPPPAAPVDDDDVVVDDDDTSPGTDDDDTTEALDDDDVTPEPDDDDDATVEPVADDAEVVISSMPASMECGESFSATITMRNTGTATWLGAAPNAHKLGAVDDSDPFIGPDPRIYMGEDATVPPGATWTFTLPMTAPDEAGTYTSDWRMVHEGVTWFGESETATVDVECTAPVWVQVACARNGSEICDDEVFGVSAGVTYGVLCEGPNNGIGYVATNTGPAQADGVNRCQGWEDQGLDAWDYLDYVDSMVCDTAGEVLELDLSPWAGGNLWFGSHDNPGGGGSMTNICLVELQ